MPPGVAKLSTWASSADAQAKVDEALALDERLRAAQTALQVAQAERNDASKKIGQAKAAKDEAQAARLMAQVETLKTTLEEQTTIERDTREALHKRGCRVDLTQRLANEAVDVQVTALPKLVGVSEFAEDDQ